MIQWDDSAVYDFLKEFGNNSSRLDRICAAAIKENRIQFTEIDIDQIVTKNYPNYQKRTDMYARRIEQGKPIGTLFCRPKPDNKWFLKDGNHRYRALKAKGITRLRIGYDMENII